jgi:hypothetical protein
MKHLIFIVFLAALTGCAPKHQNLDAFYTHQPRSIAVVPVVNESTEVTANNVFAATISKPLSERGYYVFPVLITDLILRDFGLTYSNCHHNSFMTFLVLILYCSLR